MSKFVKHETPRPKGVKVALIFGIIWAILLVILWFIFKGDQEAGGGFSNFLGRFHPLIVHLPIGVIFLALFIEILGRFSKNKHIRDCMPLVLWIAFFTSILSTVLGFLLMGAEGTSGTAMDRHFWSGLSVVPFSMMALIFCLLKEKLLYGVALLASGLAVAVTGHFGGAMIHEKDYLTEHAPDFLKPVLGAGLGESPPSEEPTTDESKDLSEVALPLAERNAYTELVAPILEAKCNECHNENKIKGKLRLDTHAMILAGAEGSDFPTVDPGKPDDSELIVRVTLPSDDDDFMPPKGDGLTSEEIALLKLWIGAGAKEDITVAQLGDDASVMTTAEAVAALHAGEAEEVDDWEPEWESLSEDEKQSRLIAVQEEAKRFNFSVMPLSAEDSRLRVNVINAAKEFGDEQLAVLDPVAEYIAWLDLGRSQITDDGMRTVGHMLNLERLHLENTGITDEGIARLTALSKLNYLNLYGTKVTNGVFDHFRAMPGLRKVFLWQTQANANEARQYERSVNLEINTGIDLEAAAAAAKAKKEADEAAAKKAEDDKKAAEAKKKADEEAAKKKAAATAAAAAKKKAEEEANRKKAAEAKAKAEEAAQKAKPTPAPKPNPGAKKPQPKSPPAPAPAPDKSGKKKKAA